MKAYWVWLWFVLLWFAMHVAQATNYTFPGNLPAGCSGSSGTYTCSALTLGYADSWTITSPIPATVTINGNMTTNTNTINTGSLAANLNLVVTGTLTATYETTINANITAGTINDSSGYVTFGGPLTITTGSVNLNYLSTVAGSITSSTGAITVGQGGLVSGDIVSSSGNVSLGYQASVTGEISTGGSITMAQGSTVSACVESSSSAAITLGYQASVDSICCGSTTCSTRCVTNNSTYSMPRQCSTSTSICDQTAGNLVNNCGFESGTTSSWNTIGNWNSGYNSIAAGGEAGSHSGTYELDMGNITTATGGLSQVLKTMPGASYQFSFWAWQDAGYEQLITASWNGVSLLSLTANTSGWTQYSYTVTGTGADTIAISAYNIPDWGFIDDVIVVLKSPVVVNPSPSSFNAFDTSTAANATTGFIQTKIAGTAFTFDVVALTSTPSVLSSFTSAVTVELVDATTSSTCSTMTSIQTVASSYTFTATDSGRHTFSGVTQAQAYPNAKVRISYPAVTPTTVVCSSDAFAIRPSYFTVTATDATWSTPGTSRILNASTTTGTPTHKAGQPLTIIVTPYNSANVVTSTYSGAPVASVSCLLPASGCVAGVFGAGSFALSGGVATSNSANYSEVGVVSLSVSDATFAGVDGPAIDGSSTSQITISSTATTVGRFVPDHFDATLNTPVFAPACVTFTYIGQPIKYATNPVATVTAKNVAGLATQNYTSASGLFKISPGNVTYGISPSYAEASQAVSVLNSAVPVAADNGSGVSTLTFADTSSNILGITRPNNPFNPINAFNANIALSFTLQDTDGVTVGNVNGAAASNPVHFGTASSGAGISFTGGYNIQKWGRLAMSNANGSELTALVIPLFVEYYNGTAFVGNSSDNCTSISLTNQISLSNPSTGSGAAQAGTAAMTVGSATSSTSLSAATLAAGSSSISFSAPGAGNTGYINITSNIASLLPWLLYPWNQGGAANTSPAAVATFGVYQGNPNIIYFREIY